MTITEFLLARIGEDEERANSTGSKALVDPRWVEYPGEIYDLFRDVTIAVAHRTLAECQAKRAIVKEYLGEVARGPAAPRDGLVARHEGILDAYAAALRILATVYSDHPDYREEWQP